MKQINTRNKTEKGKKAKIVLIILLALLAILQIILLINRSKSKTPKVSEFIAKGTNTNIVLGKEYDISQLTTVEPNAPVISAGMIPVKYSGTAWVITTADDANWYNYEKGEPAYMMLNDGKFQSELQVDMSGKALASENKGAQINKLGTIYAWIPRYAYSSDRREDIYLKQGCTIAGNYTVPQAFTYDEFSLSGVWVQIKPISSSTLTSTLKKMQGKDNTYSFIGNTIAESATTEYTRLMNKYTGSKIENTSNTTRAVIKVANDKIREPIKATASYNQEEQKVIIQITYTANGINKVIDKDGNELKITRNSNGTVTASTENMELWNADYTFAIIDKIGNQKELSLTVTGVKGIYATYYTDGTLALSNDNSQISGKTVADSWNITGEEYEYYQDEDTWEGYTTTPWYDYRRDIKTVEILNEIQPLSTACWFSDCENLTAINNIANLDTSEVTDMSYMFYYCSGLTNLNVSGFNTSKVTNMDSMFRKCSKLTSLDVSNFNTSNVTNMKDIFSTCTNLKSINVSSFDTSKATTMQGLFYNCSSLTSLDVTKFNTKEVTNMSLMFGDCSKLTSLNVSGFNTSKVTDMCLMFDGCSNLTSLDVTNFDTSKVTDTNSMFDDCSSLTSLDLCNFNTSNVTDMSVMFSNCTKLKTIYVGQGWTTANVTTTDMFSSCGTSSVTKTVGYATYYTDGTLGIGCNHEKISGKTVSSSWHITESGYTSYSSVPWYSSYSTSIKTVQFVNAISPKSTAYWFYKCTNLTTFKNIEKLNTSNVTDMSYMFYYCSSLTTLNVANFDTSKVTNMDSMFRECSKITSLDVSKFNTSNVTNMKDIFSTCESLKNIDVSNFDTSKVTTMQGLFYFCFSLTSLDLSSFNTKKVTNMTYMFYGSEKLTKIYIGSNWVTASTNSNMFTACGTSTLTRK